MPWHFVDAQGREGWVRDDRSVVYFGDADIGEAVERHAAEMEADPRGTEDALQPLMIRLYADEGLWMVERCNGDADPTPRCRPRG